MRSIPRGSHTFVLISVSPFRHCQCVYYQDWNRTRRPKPAVEGGGILPGVSRAVAPTIDRIPANLTTTPHNAFTPSSGVVIAVSDDSAPPSSSQLQVASSPHSPQTTSTGLPFDEEAKLVYGVIISLRNMVRKLSGRYGLCSRHLSTYSFNTHMSAMQQGGGAVYQFPNIGIQIACL